ncbi:TM2 domain-containing protein [Sphingomonas paeninsulae]|uniref:TM2 domain-containing protein n=1 Tax=Sphingomonas paeninsulae TaxID=2319844 RepID=A0A494TP55_SPHPE|nr:TM2 domain-containing protein [Sphingomonas paeninsulae]AYJ87641.1 TM2 domain-containing protein [Sphingomonas paeninsulae]
MALSTAQLQLIEQRVTNEGASVAVAYLLWLFLGLVSAHRFYLGRPASAIMQILSYFIVIGFIWLLIDGFLIPGMVRTKQGDIRQREMVSMLAQSAGGGAL